MINMYIMHIVQMVCAIVTGTPKWVPKYKSCLL